MTEAHANEVPSAWVCRFAALVPAGGTVLDVACGAGRHTRWLAAQGFRVVAVDRDEAAIRALERSGCAVEALCAELEEGPWPFVGREFDGIVVTNYLHRPLFPALRAALARRGVLIYETFMQGNERFGRPSNPRFLLKPGELLEEAAGLQVVAFEQGEVRRPRPAVMQRVAAVRAAEPMPLEGGPPGDGRDVRNFRLE